MKSILEFKDYRLFLREHYREKKNQNNKWTYGVWARKMNLGASNSLTMIVNGKRHPGPLITEKFLNYFLFKDREKNYFLDLIELSKASQSHSLGLRKHLILEENVKKMRNRKPSHLIDLETFYKISRWYCYVIRQMTRLKEFRLDVDWIKNHMYFPVSREEIQAAIQILLQLGLLKINKNQTCELVKTAVHTSDDVSSEGLKRFHEEMISHAKESIRKFSIDEREVNALTMSIQKKQIPQAKELIRRFLDEFELLGCEHDGDDVYQLNIQFFPTASASTTADFLE